MLLVFLKVVQFARHQQSGREIESGCKFIAYPRHIASLPLCIWSNTPRKQSPFSGIHHFFFKDP